MSGLFKSNYLKKNETKVLLATQFEPICARRCFPCFDEPSFKATFNLTISCPVDKTVISNTNIKSQKIENDIQTVSFETTPIMSTYLLAFVIGEFDFLETKTSNGLPIRVFTPPEKKEQGRFALEVASKAIPVFEKFFGQKYSLSKLDLVAIPDFSSAMGKMKYFLNLENWGLLTFKETYILFDEKESSLQNKQEIALVVCHECAHMWFGNIVTMKWWNDLYLNEGFATWKEHYAVSQMFPEWKIFDQFVDDHYRRAQELDGLETSHPIDVNIEYQEQIDEIFDAISYSKGCSIIRMLVDYLGIDLFRDGIQYYMEKFKFKNAASDDLWDCLSRVSKIDVKSMMSLWTKQKGYPLIILKEEILKDKKIIKMKQIEYKDNGKFGKSKWIIPITYFTSKNSKEIKFMMEKEEMSIEVDLDVEWIKLNTNQTGFYRVQYPKSYYTNSLFEAVKNHQLNDMDAFGIQYDLLALCRSSQISISDVLNFLKAYQDYEVFIVWQGISFTLSSIWNIFKYQESHQFIKDFGKNLFQKISKKVGWKNEKNESHLNILLRYLALNNSVTYGNIEIMKEGKEIFLKDGYVEPDLRQVIYKIIFTIGTKEEKEKLLNDYNNSTFTEEKIRILSEIGNETDKTELEKYLKFGFSEKVRKEDVFELINSISRNFHGREMVWSYFKDHFDEIFKKYSGGMHNLGKFVKISTDKFSTLEKKKEIEEFFELHPIPEAQIVIQNCLEKIQININWTTRKN